MDKVIESAHRRSVAIRNQEREESIPQKRRAWLPEEDQFLAYLLNNHSACWSAMSEEAKGKGVLKGNHYEQGALKDHARTPKTSILR